MSTPAPSIKLPGAATRIAFIGNSLPRRCGIATFTTDLEQAVSSSRADVETCVVAMNDHGRGYDYPPVVRCEVRDGEVEDYVAAAAFLNAGGFDAVSLQHEFGIFGGEAGEHVLALVSRLTAPLVTTLHTLLSEPTPAQRRVLDRIIDASAKVVVMAERGRRILQTVYGVAADRIEVIAHGIPDVPFIEPCEPKARLGFADRAVILTFGLLSPNKGVEVMIDAMPSILARRPDAVYVVLGATHPNLVLHEGEAYRERLMARTRELGVEDHVVFLDQFVDQATLLSFISMCDVYVTPYLHEAQMTSGTLAYSFGLGRAVVSTPYWHAQELLADGRGILVPFGDSAAVGAAVSDLLIDDDRRHAMRERAYANSRSMTWERTAERYLLAFEDARQAQRQAASALTQAAPAVRIDHFLSMCDDTGLLQHAVNSVPDRAHGYCVDDNARALLLACALNGGREEPLPGAVTARLAAFVQHAWNPDTGRFRNFMSYERRWLEASGSEDSHGRTLWALGECARGDADPARRRWAAALFAEALPSVVGFTSPRAWAFTLLGLDAYCGQTRDDAAAERVRLVLAERLVAILSIVENPDWTWFEEGLAYDNARLPQALLATGLSRNNPVYIQAGLRSLRWLMRVQTSPAQHFRPVGSEGFGDERTTPRPFDQQPIEAAASISACLAAWRATGDALWTAEAARAFAWFLGANDLATPLADVETGACRDGLHPDRANDNRGAESTLSYLLGLAEMRQLEASRRLGTAPSQAAVTTPIPYLTPNSRGRLVAIPLPEPAGALFAPGSLEGRGPALQAGHGAARPQSNGQDPREPYR